MGRPPIKVVLQDQNGSMALRVNGQIEFDLVLNKEQFEEQFSKYGTRVTEAKYVTGVNRTNISDFKGNTLVSENSWFKPERHGDDQPEILPWVDHWSTDIYYGTDTYRSFFSNY